MSDLDSEGQNKDPLVKRLEFTVRKNNGPQNTCNMTMIYIVPYLVQRGKNLIIVPFLCRYTAL